MHFGHYQVLQHVPLLSCSETVVLVAVFVVTSVLKPLQGEAMVAVFPLLTLHLHPSLEYFTAESIS